MTSAFTPSKTCCKHFTFFNKAVYTLFLQRCFLPSLSPEQRLTLKKGLTLIGEMFCPLPVFQRLKTHFNALSLFYLNLNLIISILYI